MQPLRVEPEAQSELAEAVAWYENEREGLGDELANEAEACFTRIEQQPRAGSLVPHVQTQLPVRRRIVARFPYSVVYLLTEAELSVVAFAHHKRRPGYWTDRLL